jgi:hypothetical protein
VKALADDRERTVGFGPVGVAGIALLVLGVLSRRRVLALLGLGAVVADMTRPELGGFAALNERGWVEPEDESTDAID